MSKLSIIIPVYNAEKFIKETLLSIQSQTFTDFECIVVNDGSTDNSLKVIEQFINNDKRFKLISIENSGCADIPRHVGIRNSKSDFVFLIDADDIVDKNCLELLVNRQIETDSDVILMRLIGCVNDIEGELYRIPDDDFNMDQIISGQDAFLKTIDGWKISFNGMFVKRSLFVNNIPGKWMNSDEFSHRKIILKAKKVAFVDSWYRYRNHKSTSRTLNFRFFERANVDAELNEFIVDNFDDKSLELRLIRKARFFNLIHLVYDYYKNKFEFSKYQKKQIKSNFKKLYYSQDLKQLRIQFPKHCLFFLRYSLFYFISIIYCMIKDVQGEVYIYK